MPIYIVHIYCMAANSKVADTSSRPREKKKSLPDALCLTVINHNGIFQSTIWNILRIGHFEWALMIYATLTKKKKSFQPHYPSTGSIVVQTSALQPGLFLDGALHTQHQVWVNGDCELGRSCGPFLCVSFSLFSFEILHIKDSIKINCGKYKASKNPREAEH